MKDLSVLLDEAELYLSDEDLAYLLLYLHVNDFNGYNLKNGTVEGLLFLDRVGASNLMNNKLSEESDRLQVDVDDKVVMRVIKLMLAGVIASLETDPYEINSRVLWRSYEQIKQLPFSDLVKRIRRHHGRG